MIAIYEESMTMRIQMFAYAIVAVGMVLTASANARDVNKFDPMMAKRADLRVNYQRALREARVHQPTNEATASNDTRTRLRQAGVDDSRLLDFMVLSTKRADLRVRTAQVGVENAYVEWLHNTR